MIQKQHNIKKYPNHIFSWFITANAPSSKQAWKNLEEKYIALKKKIKLNYQFKLNIFFYLEPV